MRPLPVEPGAERTKIGNRLRSARQAQGITLEQLADTTGLTRGFLSRVERDQTSPSVATLVRICQVLSIEIGALFAEPEVSLVRAGTGPRINLGGANIVEHLLTPRHEKRVQVVATKVEPRGTGGEQLYTVASEVDVVYVVSGSIHLVFTTEEITLSAGDTLTFPGKEPHTWRNASSRAPAEVLWILAPAAWSGTY